MKLAAECISKNYIRERADSNILAAVSEVSIEIEPGKITVLSGPSGSGKSTLLNMLAGLLPPTSGKVTLDGTDIYALDDKQLSLLRNKHFGIIPQGQSALQSLNVLENVLAPYILYNRPSGAEYEAAKKRAQMLLEEAGIAQLEKVMPAVMSGGELRRMAICRAMIMNPAVILADEPTGDLDEENTEAVIKLLKGSAEGGAGVFVVTHDSQVYSHADTALIMKRGRITEGE